MLSIFKSAIVPDQASYSLLGNGYLWCTKKGSKFQKKGSKWQKKTPEITLSKPTPRPRSDRCLNAPRQLLQQTVSLKQNRTITYRQLHHRTSRILVVLWLLQRVRLLRRSRFGIPTINQTSNLHYQQTSIMPPITRQVHANMPTKQSWKLRDWL